MVSVIIRSGGQTGVDRAALDFAVKRGWSYGGWCPHGGWAEDQPSARGVTARGVIDAYPRLAETPSEVPEQRTAWNVRDSHATMILVRGNELASSPGTVFTRQAAELVFLRPWLVVDISQAGSVRLAREWLSRTIAALDVSELWLNIAGPRESEAEGLYTAAGEFLDALFPSS